METYSITINDENELRQYLEDVYTLEKEKYCTEQAMERTSRIKDGLGVERDIRPQKSYAVESAAGYLLAYYPVVGFVFVLGFLFAFYYKVAFTTYLLICGVLLFIVFMGALAVDFKKGKRYQNEAKIEKIKDQQRVAEELKLVPGYEKNIEEYKNNIAMCDETLMRLYNLNVIFPKYRNFPAVSQMLEYISSGRCEELTGQAGAYNLYEMELRQNLIISRLEDISEQLDEIKENQYMLYSAICQTNNILSGVYDSAKATAYNTSVIAMNTAICARYSNVVVW